MAELDDYFAEQRPLLRAGDDAQEIYRFLTDPPMPPGLRRLTAPLGPMGTPLYGVASRQVWSRMSRVAYSALPDWAVELYSHPGLLGSIDDPLAALPADRGPDGAAVADRAGRRALTRPPARCLLLNSAFVHRRDVDRLVHLEVGHAVPAHLIAHARLAATAEPPAASDGRR